MLLLWHADHEISLGSLFIQLKSAIMDSDRWYQFGKALGTTKELLDKCTRLQPDQSLMEILDDWLKNHSGQPSWNEIAEALTEIGLEQLAHDIKSVYRTGMKQKANNIQVIEGIAEPMYNRYPSGKNIFKIFTNLQSISQ